MFGPRRLSIEHPMPWYPTGSVATLLTAALEQDFGLRVGLAIRLDHEIRRSDSRLFQAYFIICEEISKDQFDFYPCKESSRASVPPISPGEELSIRHRQLMALPTIVSVWLPELFKPKPIEFMCIGIYRRVEVCWVRCCVQHGSCWYDSTIRKRELLGSLAHHRY